MALRNAAFTWMPSCNSFQIEPSHLGVAQHNEAVLGACERHVEAAWIRQEADALRLMQHREQLFENCQLRLSNRT